MNCWRALPELLEHEDVVLVTVAQTRGSVPREAGTSMLVSMGRTVDTIGGGHLEWEAMAHARAMLLQPTSAPALQRLSLGASLGQCCGGVVWLVFERIARGEREVWVERSASIGGGTSLTRKLSSEDNSSHWEICSRDEGRLDGGARLRTYHPPLPGADTPPNEAGAWQLTQIITPPSFNITLFGAGHVGAAIVKVLSTLEDTHIRWVDVRDDLFGSAPAKVTCITTDTPEEEVDKATPDTFFLVLTHSHTLDLALTTRILKRDAFAWFGLIGSRTKRARFEHRLHAQGIGTEQLSRMICPIGVAGISDKTPQAIAIAVVAQLLQAREQYESRANHSLDAQRDRGRGERELTHDD